MKLYSADIRVLATVYVKAEDPETAAQLIRDLDGDALEVSDVASEVPICGFQFNDPNLPTVSVSPTMTIDMRDGMGPDGLSELEDCL